MTGQPYVIIRTEKAGCFAGTLVGRDGAEVALKGARRLWYWAGAASLSSLAVYGTSEPEKCQFPAAVDVVLLGVIEIINVTEKGRQSIEGVPIWNV